MARKTFTPGPAAQSCTLIRFMKASVVAGKKPVLVVEGKAPCINMTVFLSPRVYVVCPKWWGIEVVGCLPSGICLTALKSYKVKLPLHGIIGSKGIEVIGATQSKKIPLAGGCAVGPLT